MHVGTNMILDERKRQLEDKGYDTDRDMRYNSDELACAAACYATPHDMRQSIGFVGTLWPWAYEFYKPTPDNRIKELAKAGALIAAEIDRLYRASLPLYFPVFADDGTCLEFIAGPSDPEEPTNDELLGQKATRDGVVIWNKEYPDEGAEHIQYPDAVKVHLMNHCNASIVMHDGQWQWKVTL